MSIRRFVPWLLVPMSLLLGLVSCRMPWGERAPEVPPPQTKLGSEARCLSSVYPLFKNYIRGEARPAQVSEIWSCFQDALSLFKSKVRGDNPGFYRSDELKLFFEQYFLAEGTKLSPEFIHELMLFKQLLVGGDENNFSRDEFESLILLAKKFETLSQDLLPHITVFLAEWTPGDDVQKFEAAKEVIENSVVSLAQLIEARNQNYQLVHLGNLFDETAKAFGENWSFVLQLKKAIPVIGKIKKSLMGTSEELVQANEWRKFGLLGIRSYMIYLRYFYFVKDAKIEKLNLLPVFQSIDDLLITSGEFISSKPGSRIVQSEIQEILEAARSFFPDLLVTPELLTELMRIKKLLVGGSMQEFSPGDFQVARGKLSSVRGTAELLNHWAEIFTGEWKPQSLSDSQAHQEAMI
jgi:hypothetical protein